WFAGVGALDRASPPGPHAARHRGPAVGPARVRLSRLRHGGGNPRYNGRALLRGERGERGAGVTGRRGVPGCGAGGGGGGTRRRGGGGAPRQRFGGPGSGRGGARGIGRGHGGARGWAVCQRSPRNLSAATSLRTRDADVPRARSANSTHSGRFATWASRSSGI